MMSAQRLRIIIAAFIVLMPVGSAAEQSHAQWYACQRDDQCAIVDGGQCGVEWAANKQFVQQTQDSHPPVACDKPIEFHPADTVARCENNYCVLSPAGMYAGGTPMKWYACKRDDQCVIVDAGQCGLEWAANKEFAEQTRKTRWLITCSMPAMHPAGTIAKCEDGKCMLWPEEGNLRQK